MTTTIARQHRARGACNRLWGDFWPPRYLTEGQASASKAAELPPWYCAAQNKSHLHPAGKRGYVRTPVDPDRCVVLAPWVDFRGPALRSGIITTIRRAWRGR
jgi:hypothetical protein